MPFSDYWQLALGVGVVVLAAAVGFIIGRRTVRADLAKAVEAYLASVAESASHAAQVAALEQQNAMLQSRIFYLEEFLANAGVLVDDDLSGLDYQRSISDSLDELAAIDVPTNNPLSSEVGPEPAGSIAGTGQIDCLASGPISAKAGERILLNVIVFQAQDREGAVARLRLDPAREEILGEATLLDGVRLGQRLDIVVESDTAKVEIASQMLTWRGTFARLIFRAQLPDGTAPRHDFMLRILLEGVPIAYLPFVVQVGEQQLKGRFEANVRRYRRAFVSYSSDDRARVLEKVEILSVLGVETFQDFLSIRTGERWDERLESELKSCDLFLLFWSKSAARSNWVRREIRAATVRQTSSAENLPHIYPFKLEKNAPPPPRELKAKQFGVFMRTLIDAVEDGGKKTSV